MRLALALTVLAIACASITDAQAPAIVVFNDFPTMKGMTIGQSHIYIWGAHLPPPWPIIIGYYDSNGSATVQGVNLTGDRKLEGQFNSTDGAFTWTLQNDVSGAVNFGLAATATTPTGGQSREVHGTF